MKRVETPGRKRKTNAASDGSNEPPRKKSAHCKVEPEITEEMKEPSELLLFDFLTEEVKEPSDIIQIDDKKQNHGIQDAKAGHGKRKKFGPLEEELGEEEEESSEGKSNQDQEVHMKLSKTFIPKLWKLVDDAATNDVIAWDTNDKTRFHIKDLEKLKTTLRIKYESFRRQLYNYGFKSHNKDEFWSHPELDSTNKQKTFEIRRRVQKRVQKKQNQPSFDEYYKAWYQFYPQMFMMHSQAHQRPQLNPSLIKFMQQQIPSSNALNINLQRPAVPPPSTGEASVEESTQDKVLADEMESSDASESEGEIGHKLKCRYNYKGVYRSGISGWQARGIVDGKQIHLASGLSKEACAQEAAQKVVELRSLGRAVRTDYGSLINQPMDAEEDSEENTNVEQNTSDKQYVVENILGHRYNSYTYEFLVKWKNYPSADNSWEPPSSFATPSACLSQYLKRNKIKLGPPPANPQKMKRKLDAPEFPKRKRSRPRKPQIPPPKEKKGKNTYVGTKFNKQTGKWGAYRKIQGVAYLGDQNYDNEEDAARESDRLLSKHIHKKRKKWSGPAPRWNFEESKSQAEKSKEIQKTPPKKPKKKSQYIGVKWEERTKKWYAARWIRQTRVTTKARFGNEMEAARESDRIALKNSIKRKKGRQITLNFPEELPERKPKSHDTNPSLPKGFPDSPAPVCDTPSLRFEEGKVRNDITFPSMEQTKELFIGIETIPPEPVTGSMACVLPEIAPEPIIDNGIQRQSRSRPEQPRAKTLVEEFLGGLESKWDSLRQHIQANEFSFNDLEAMFSATTREEKAELHEFFQINQAQAFAFKCLLRAFARSK